MELDVWRDALWQQFGAAIDMLDEAIVACPAARWTEPIWRDPPPPWFPPRFAEFWYVGYHAMVWLDLYLSGRPEAEFTAPAPFLAGEIDAVATMPDHPYGREDLRAYLAALRRRCHDTLAALTDEQARQPVDYPWTAARTVTYLELLLYTMRHVQEHAAQLNLALGQHDRPDVPPGWIAQAADG
jgi:hypothetical protein